MNGRSVAAVSVAIAAIAAACSAQIGGLDAGSTAAAGGSAATGTGGTGAVADGGVVISCDIAGLISRSCTASICHSASRREGDLILQYDDPLGAQMAKELVGAYASYSGVQDPENCPAEREIRVDPANIDNSLVIKKVDGTQHCGEQMPNTSLDGGSADTLDDWTPDKRAASQQCIHEWVRKLAALHPNG